MSEESRLDWAEKYRPVSLSDVVGNDAAVKALKKWAESFDSGKKAAILYGGPGIGKTSAALALAHDMGWDYIEMNASDQRTKDAINKVAGSASKTGTFGGTNERRLLILDEADNLHGNYDRGGEAAIINVIKNTNQPIVLIANDFYALSKPLRDAAEPIQFRALLSSSIARVLKKVCMAENIRCQPDALMKIAERTNDMRSAINDLQAAAMGQDEVTLADVTTGERDVPESIFKVMGLIFRGDDPERARRAVMELDESPEDLVGWVDENLPREYRDDDLERGFDVLSKADMFLGRVRRRMDYGMWRYASFMMVAGVNRARKHRYGGYTRYSAPTYWQKLGRARGSRAVRDSLAGKIGGYCHASRREARAVYIPLLRILFQDEDYAVGITARLRLEEDDIAFLMEAEKSSKKVEKIYEKSRDLIEKEVEQEIDAFARFAPKESAKIEPVVEEAPKPKRKRKTARDGGDVEKAPVIIEPMPEEPKKEEAPAEPKSQRTLFDF
ncbi:MAG TPA: replication factor C large subunit [Methanocella sp.]|uniref:replication factor C large subunit n=1 Tax=Methanocella sp. TaxID=2052833 RepID=UPI002CE32E2D|nr:replication factor C large subunit [Methanocella sp.]HTY92101.1 replication factor C large subunit [Methanocella sp.]